MDYADLFERQGRAFDDLLMAAAKLPPEQFTAPGPADGPSVRDLLVAMLDEQRRLVHGALLARRHVPLAPDRIVSPLELGPVFGGFRLTLIEHLDTLSREDLAKEVDVAAADGTSTKATVDDVLAHLVLVDARLRGLAEERLRQLGVTVTAPPLLP